jgi:Asp-tRNA(Asn)/Glu-tRNA(Gln) amidotransferase A subunit family amidase
VDTATARRRIAARSDLNAFISLSMEKGPGPVVGVKDVVDVEGLVTTGGGILLPAEPAEKDATCVAELRASGACVIGKTNLHEWAFGPTSSNPHFGVVRNPRDPERIPGGSSGGSAAAVAAGLCDWAIGTDTGGSVRMPAALCGVVGMKPTRGKVSTAGVVPLAPTLDTIGPIAPDVGSAARALEVLTGRIGCVQPSTVGSPGDYRAALPRAWVTDLDPEVALVWNQVARGLPEIDFPEMNRFAAAFAAICGYEAARFHRRWLETCPDRYGADVLERLRQGLAVEHDAYEAALAESAALRDDVTAAMATVDALVLPATACVAPRLDGPDMREPLTRYLRAFSVTGHPAVVVPAPAPRLPVGIQLVGKLGHDAQLLGFARSFERTWRRHEARLDMTTEGRANV